MGCAFNPEAAAGAVRAFLSSRSAVDVWESGRRVARLESEQSGFSISLEGAGERRLICHFWSSGANLVRRVVGMRPQRGERLGLQCLRMGARQPTALVLAAADAGADGDRSARQEFRQMVLAAAARDWPEWRPVPLPEAGFASGAVHRFLLRHQRKLLVCVAVDERASPHSRAGALGQALLLAEQARARWPELALGELRLVLPEPDTALVAERRTGMRRPPETPPLSCYALDRSAGQLNRLEWPELGNVRSTLRRATSRAAPDPDALRLLAEIREICPQTTLERTPDGRLAYRYYGLEIAREADSAAGARFCFGCGREQTPLVEAVLPQWLAFLTALGEHRVAGRDARDPLYALQPERWMEHLLRSDLTALDPSLDLPPARRQVYAQVPLCLPASRDVLDLLTIDRAGRLVVVELKAEEDFGFPLQALDYWLRVRTHQRAGDFERLGYFPGLDLSPLPPRLLLVAPALRWHPRTEAVMGWLSHEIAWTRIGINEAWRHGIQVVYRKEGPHARS